MSNEADCSDAMVLWKMRDSCPAEHESCVQHEHEVRIEARAAAQEVN